MGESVPVEVVPAFLIHGAHAEVGRPLTDPLFGHTRDTGTDDPGCDAAFEALDRYIEALLRGDDVTATYADVVTHLRNCSACREDAEGLLAALRELEHPSPDQT